MSISGSSTRHLEKREQQMPRQLRMVRPNLENLPKLELPTGYGMRTYREGDEATLGTYHQRFVWG